MFFNDDLELSHNSSIGLFEPKINHHPNNIGTVGLLKNPLSEKTAIENKRVSTAIFMQMVLFQQPHCPCFLGAGQVRLIKKLRTVVYPQLKTRPHLGPNIKKHAESGDRHGRPPSLRSEPVPVFRDTWRFRINAWRFFYEIDEENKRVWFIAAAHRGSAY
jgi:mRNA interferase RelE/StbE